MGNSPTKKLIAVAKKIKKESNSPTQQIVCGFHGVRSLLTRPTDVIEVLISEYRQDKRRQQLQKELDQSGIGWRDTTSDELDKLANGVKHQGVIARILMQPPTDSAEQNLIGLLDGCKHNCLLLILDQVQDPHNLGACLRTANAAGVDAVILSKNRSCPITPTVIRVANGAIATLSIFYVVNLVRTLKDLQKRGIWIVGGEGNAKHTLYEVDLTTDVALVIGGEGDGLRRLTGEYCDRLVRIPMLGSISSLNVSVATGLLLFESVRQRMPTNRSM